MSDSRTHFSSRIGPGVVGPCNYWQIGEELPFLSSLAYKLLCYTILHVPTKKEIIIIILTLNIKSVEKLEHRYLLFGNVSNFLLL